MEKRFVRFAAIALVCTSWMASGGQAKGSVTSAALSKDEISLLTPAYVRDHLGKNFSGGLFFHRRGERELVLIGPIDPGMAKAVKQFTDADGRISTLIVDSYGGNIESAMDIADIIRHKKLSLVVDGRCLSACANYLFTAAASKSVLPGSVVGIHNLTASYIEKGMLKRIPGSAARDVFLTSGDYVSLQQVEKILARERKFYQDLGIRQDLHTSFLRYLANRKAKLGTEMIDSSQSGGTACPPFQIWALDKQQLESIGVTGIGGFWYPSGAAEKESLLNMLGLPPAFLYFGAARELEQVCGKSNNYFASFVDWIARSVAAVRH